MLHLFAPRLLLLVMTVLSIVTLINSWQGQSLRKGMALAGFLIFSILLGLSFWEAYKKKKSGTQEEN